MLAKLASVEAVRGLLDPGESAGDRLFVAAVAAGLLALVVYMFKDLAGDMVQYDPDKKPAGDVVANLFAQFCLYAMFAVVWPAEATLIHRSGEGATKGNLSALRAALADAVARGPAPATLEGLAAVGGPAHLPNVRVGYKQHPRTRDSVVLKDGVPTDSGKWGYIVTASSASVIVDCTHTDSKGSTWTSY